MHTSSESSNANAESHILQRPATEAIGVLPAFTVHTEPTTLKLQEKRIGSLSGDDFHITDIHGKPIMMCKAKSFSLHGRKEFYDAAGQLLFHMKKHGLSNTFDAFSPQDERILFTVKHAWSVANAKLNVIFVNAADSKEHSLALRGDYFDRKASITLGGPDGPVVGTISWSFLNTSQLLSDKQTYYLTVAPGVDIALLVALCVCLDETENEAQTTAGTQVNIAA